MDNTCTLKVPTVIHLDNCFNCSVLLVISLQGNTGQYFFIYTSYTNTSFPFGCHLFD